MSLEFYSDGFHVPDDAHQPDTMKMLPISKAKFLSGFGFCGRFRSEMPQYNLSNYNCFNATIDAASGDVNAWMDANAANRSWNACAIVKGQKYVYFKKYLKKIRISVEVRKENW